MNWLMFSKMSRKADRLGIKIFKFISYGPSEVLFWVDNIWLLVDCLNRVWKSDGNFEIIRNRMWWIVLLRMKAGRGTNFGIKYFNFVSSSLKWWTSNHLIIKIIPKLSHSHNTKMYNLSKKISRQLRCFCFHGIHLFFNYHNTFIL